MISPTFDLKLDDFKKGFIDTTKKRAVSGMQRGLMYMAGFVAKTSKRSIRPSPKKAKAGKSYAGKPFYGKGTEIYSLPGNPPLSKIGLLRDRIRYMWDDAGKCAVIGPEKLNGRGNAPEALELGVPALIGVGRGAKRKIITVPMKPRPYMRPALQKALVIQRKENRFFKKFMDAQGQSFSVAA